MYQHEQTQRVQTSHTPLSGSCRTLDGKQVYSTSVINDNSTFVLDIGVLVESYLNCRNIRCYARNLK